MVILDNNVSFFIFIHIDTLLIWAGSNNDENALSFLEADALNEIW